MLDVNQLTLFFADRAITKDVSFAVKRRERIGLVGKNGAGKSTLLKLINGDLVPDDGSINIEKEATLGFLHQDLNSLQDQSIRKEIKSALKELEYLEKRYQDLQEEMTNRTDYESDSYMQLLNQFDLVQSRYHYLSGDQVDKAIETIAMGLGFERYQLDDSVQTLSGGWKMRVELAKILIRKPDLLLLDEPTNHLDIASIIWMEDWLNNFEGASIIISHDIQFLDNTTNRTLEIVNGKLRDYPFPYTKYKKVREEELIQQQQAYENQQKIIKEKERTIDRFRAKANKAKAAQSMIKELDRMEKVEEPDMSSAKKLNINFPPAPRSGAVVYEAKDLGHAYGNNRVFSGLDLKIERGDRIAFIGQNGQGKTTLAKIMAGVIEPTEGKLIEGHNVDLGYFAQDQAEKLNEEKTVKQISDDASSIETRNKVRSILGAFLFPGEEVDKKVKVLSGGERSRLAISLLMHENHNVLLLDEPTNHLDIQSKEVLKEALKEYDGTLLVISHDREFLSGLTKKTLAFREGVIKLHLDDVDTYLKKHSFSDMRSVEQDANNQQDNNKGNNAQSELSYEERKQLMRRINYLERDIDRLSEKIEKLESKMSEDAFYEKDDAADVAKDHAQLTDQLKSKESEWEEFVARLDH
jgi:ATP-binding cassette subfamily F protein 3